MLTKKTIRRPYRLRGTPRQVRRCCRVNRGLALIELLVVLFLLMFFFTVTVPMLLKVRMIARATECKLRISHLALGLQNYHDVHQSFPPAAIWNAEATRSTALHSSRRVDLITHENWTQFILPHIGEQKLAAKFSPQNSIGHPSNSEARETELAAMSCPDDTYNRKNNFYKFRVNNQTQESISFARGNYAINGGTQSLPVEGPSTASPYGDYTRLVMQRSPKKYQLWGNGIAGINRAFSLSDMTSGQSHVVAFDEIRAGIHPRDPRGVWALGQIGGSLTWAHGIGSDAYGPNNPWARSDDILGCRELHQILGEEKLLAEGMPCVHYVDGNRQATARSLHVGGAHVAFLDGSVRFISNEIDPGIWHVIHSRETPVDAFGDNFDTLLSTTEFSEEKERTHEHESTSTETQFENSVGMTFQLIKADSFVMGTPDRGNFKFLTADYPLHDVSFSQDFLMGIHEVTQEQFRKVMGGPPQAMSSETGTVDLAATLPVVYVTWLEAEEFCRKLSEIQAEQNTGRRYRLPTEAEWEYVCRAGTDAPYRWRKVRSTQDVSGEAAGILPTVPLSAVGSFPPNRLGIFDMRGNAWEWTADWFDRDYYKRSPESDPQGPANGFIKVVRGSDWRYVGEICHIDYPMMPPWVANPYVGFRVVCEVELPE